MSEGRSFEAVLGDVMHDDLAREEARLQAEARAREALRHERDALAGVKTYTASELMLGVLAEGEKAAADLRPVEEKKDAQVQPTRPAVQGSFPPPFLGR